LEAEQFAEPETRPKAAQDPRMPVRKVCQRHRNQMAGILSRKRIHFGFSLVRVPQILAEP
jgi:hypothetical protein